MKFMNKTYNIFTRGIRRKPIREVSFHPVLASYQLSSMNLSPSPLISPNTSLFQALEQFRDLQQTALLVGDDTMIGIVSVRDLIRKTDCLPSSLETLKIGEVMSQDPKWLTPDQSLDEAVEVMFNGSFRHLPIIGKENYLLGINQCLSELLRVQVLHKYNKASQNSLKSLGGRFVRISEEESVTDALKLMNSADVSSLIVFKQGIEGKELAGILSESDFSNKVALQKKDPEAVQIAEIITPAHEVKGISEGKNVLQGLEALIKTSHRHLPLFGEVANKGDSENIIYDQDADLKVSGMFTSKHLIKYVYQI
eukprot:maker-scaffold_20-snap-gene-2.7-mRNA-1 protein AED:0.02 eAED:0.02 QI:227/1/1/1/1/1/4/459/309